MLYKVMTIPGRQFLEYNYKFFLTAQNLKLFGKK